MFSLRIVCVLHKPVTLTTMFCAVCSKLCGITYNAALNRPAYQTSVYLGTNPARFANDGSRHNKWHTGTKCAVSNRTNNPWWAVDLGQPTDVYKVAVTGSVDLDQCK